MGEVVPLRPPLPPPAEVAVSETPEPARDIRWSHYARLLAAVAVGVVLLAALVGGLSSFASMIF